MLNQTLGYSLILHSIPLSWATLGYVSTTHRWIWLQVRLAEGFSSASLSLWRTRVRCALHQPTVPFLGQIETDPEKENVVLNLFTCLFKV